MMYCCEAWTIKKQQQPKNIGIRNVVSGENSMNLKNGKKHESQEGQKNQVEKY